MTRDDNVLLNDVYFNAYNTNSPLTPLTPISKLFAPFEAIGVHSGVPTRTTPTLTPTTLKNIEQSIMGLTSDNQINLPYQAGFVPPPFPLEELSQDREASQESFSSTSNASWPVSGSGHGYGADDVDSKSSTSTLDPPLSTNSSSAGRAAGQRYGAVGGVTTAIGGADGAGGGGGAVSAAAGAGAGAGAAGAGATTGSAGSRTRRNVGGRRPHKPSNLSPEEEEKRRIRRERNKQAAARCRRRREDHTNELVDETDQLEKQNQQLHQEVQSLKQEVQQLERIMDSHRDQPCQLRNRGRTTAAPPVQPGEQQQQQPAVVTGGNGGLASNPATVLLPLIKTEPEEDLADIPQHHQQPQDDQPDAYIARGAPPMKKIKIPPNQSDSLETPTPTTVFPHSLLSPGLTGVKLSGGGSSGASNGLGGPGRRPDRPRSLLIGSAAATAGMLNGNGHSALPGGGAAGTGAAAAAAGGGLSTPSNGLFNFDSLMEGGTGLTPIAAPISFPPNRNPLELITPTSTDSSKLCSL
ncbi:transcription factor kayak-like isoform X2 [Anopheles albimanus]|uniref:transcription factor kayak-like isoform X2 n=1 Tax=Anopheles albimanus TaxID=7167 RepID=UPI001641E432|nr:transcription factor kayak-like isoform X2 [Anopheles albimanus]